MKNFHNISSLERIIGNYIFIDNDALSTIFKDEDAFLEFKEIVKVGWPTIDPFTRFEFRRDISSPERRATIDKLIASKYFFPIAHHPSTFLPIENNALLLSRIYKHQKIDKGWSTVDLFIAGRIMYHSSNSVLITGNKKDFPSCVFDTLGVLNLEDQKGNIKPLSIIKFNQEKFNECLDAYKKSSKVY